MSEVRLRGVTAGYGKETILKGIDLTVPAGSITAVLGMSGSGKTTLLKIIAGFLRPTSGTVEIGGRMVAGPRTWVPPERRGVGYVRQEGALFPHLSVEANITFGLPWPRRRHHDRVLRLLDLVGLPAEVAGRRPDQLSGGQQQRVAMARALLNDPDLLLADEPTGQLDSATSAGIMDLFREINATGKTVILVTHDDEVAAAARRVVRLRDGQAREDPRDGAGG